MTALRYAISDTLVLAERSLRRIPRNPDLLTAFTIQPVMFVLLFVYVFGGAIEVPAEFGDYTDFLMPGIIVQSMAFGGFVTALGLAEDMQRGLIDRFRSLPMSRAAVLTGRTLADVATNLLALAVMIAVGLSVGFAISSPPHEVIAGIALMLLVGYAFSWVFAYIGLNVSSPESANAFGFMIIFPLTFAADINPFSTMVDATRALFINTPAGNDVWASVAWCVGLIVVFGTLSVNRYRRAVSS